MIALSCARGLATVGRDVLGIDKAGTRFIFRWNDHVGGAPCHVLWSMMTLCDLPEELKESRVKRNLKRKQYVELKKKIVPWLRFNQAIYEETVAEHVSGDTVWLDAGCGKHIFPPWRVEAERMLVERARSVVGCDVDQVSIRKHCTLNRLVVADLESLPLKAESVNLITCNMTVEHLDRPLAVFAEFARVLEKSGRVIIHTPNVHSYVVLFSQFIPRQFKLKLVKALDGRSDDEVFATRYRANSPRRLRDLMAQVGLNEEKRRMLASDAALAVTHPLVAALELLFIRFTLMSACRLLA